MEYALRSIFGSVLFGYAVALLFGETLGILCGLALFVGLAIKGADAKDKKRSGEYEVVWKCEHCGRAYQTKSRCEAHEKKCKKK